MKETTPAAMPPCFDRWCKKFDDLLRNKAQKREFRHYVGGLLGESERKNVSQMARDAVEVTYHKLHHFLTEATWSADKINERRLEIMSKCNQTRISRGFSLIVDDSGHRKSGNFTAGVGRQYIGEIGKTDNGNVVVTTHLYDGKKSLPRLPPWKAEVRGQRAEGSLFLLPSSFLGVCAPAIIFDLAVFNCWWVGIPLQLLLLPWKGA